METAARTWPPRQPDRLPATGSDAGHWQLLLGDGPVLAAAIHDGHAIRPALRRHLALPAEERLREEDPLTGLLADTGDSQLRVRTSRFEVDLNRPREKAFPRRPEDTWGLQVWRELPLEHEIEASLNLHDRFYRMIEQVVARQIERYGMVVVIDIHSYNHRRDGAGQAPADPTDNPDIDVGLTELDKHRFRPLTDALMHRLAEVPVRDAKPDVRANVRYPDGGYFPKWLHARFGADVCAITLEYKKMFMDEWSSTADIVALHALRAGLLHALDGVREHVR
jgi:N-formylglutamate deformylase